MQQEIQISTSGTTSIAEIINAMRQQVPNEPMQSVSPKCTPKQHALKSERESEIERATVKERERERQRQRDREERDKETERRRDKETERHRDRSRQHHEQGREAFLSNWTIWVGIEVCGGRRWAEARPGRAGPGPV